MHMLKVEVVYAILAVSVILVLNLSAVTQIVVLMLEKKAFHSWQVSLLCLIN